MRSIALVLFCLSWQSLVQAETFSGVVLGQDGQPATGAAVTAAAAFQSPPLRLKTNTDEKGSFQIDLPKVAKPDSYSLAIRWQGQGIDIDKALDAKGKEVGIRGQKLPPQTIRLRTEGNLHGKLLRAEDGGGIAVQNCFWIQERF